MADRKPKDIKIGEVFGQRVVIGPARTSPKKRDVFFRVRCSCNFENEVRGTLLLRGLADRCKTCSVPLTISPGQKFGSWTVINQASSRKGKSKSSRYFLCRCACGIEREVLSSSLTCKVSTGCNSKCSDTEDDHRTYTLKYRFQQSRSAAKRRGLSFSITSDQWHEHIVAKACYYCGATASDRFTGSWMDRLDNSKGYELDNVVPCCSKCNTARSDNFASAEFKSLMDSPKEVVRLKQLVQLQADILEKLIPGYLDEPLPVQMSLEPESA